MRRAVPIGVVDRTIPAVWFTSTGMSRIQGGLMNRAPASFGLTTAVRLVTVFVLALAAGCSRQTPPPTAPAASQVARPGAVDLSKAIAVQEAWSDLLLAHPDVAGTGVGMADGQPVLQVFLSGGRRNRLPATLSGMNVQYTQTGEFRPFALTDRTRPLAIGISLGNANECLPGTIGAIVQRGGVRYLLGPNHLLARRNAATIGEDIVQPSRPDASAACDPSSPADRVGRLADFEPLRFGGSANTIDGAIAELTTGEVTCATPPGFYGVPASTVAAPAPGLPIAKLGRTTGLTIGNIKSVNVKLNLRYPEGKVRMVGQMLTSKSFGDFGDSGSLVVAHDGTLRPVGMLIGGGNNGTGVVTPLGPLLTRFGVTLCGP
jgi:hypothetical protein